MSAAFEKHRYAILLLITALYFCAAAFHALSKPLWYDEIITVIAASRSSAAEVWRAAQATDANPPFPHLLTYFAMRLFGHNDIAARVPAMVGVWTFCLCLYRFTRRRVGIFYALAALLLPLATEAYTYSVEARAYGLELGFTGLAMAAWQACEARRKTGAALLALSLAGALLCHYYALVLWMPIAGGELFRTRQTGDFRWPVWAAMVIGTSPLAASISTVSHVVSNFVHTWATPYPAQAVEFWESGLARLIVPLVFFVTLSALLAIKRSGADDEPAEAPKLAAHELIACVLFIAAPALAVAGALFVTHSLALRYLLPCLTGFLLLAPMLLAHLANGRALPGFAMFLSTAACPVYLAIENPPAPNPFYAEPVLQQALQSGPVVVPDGQLFLRMWYYAPENLKRRLLFLSDDAAAIHYMGFETIDSGLRAIKPWCSVQVLSYAQFAWPGRELSVYQTVLRPGWLLQKITDDGGSAEIQKYSALRMLVKARLPGAATAATIH